MKGKSIPLPDEYLQDVLIRLAHHSSAIEGNTISLPDTVSIILHNTIPGKTDLRELYEITNHKEAFQYVIDQIINQKPLSTEIIKGIHERLTDRLLSDKGKFKMHDNFIIGADFRPASPHETPLLMEQWVENLNYQLDQVAKNENDIMRIVGDFHIQLERIHPFSDGNGRTGRMLMIYSLLERGLPPLIIRSEHRAEYFQLLALQNIASFALFIEKLLKEESRRHQGFIQMEDKKITVYDDKPSTEDSDVGQ
ncbi:Fic/DOC family protein [Seinonella peptonophila]|uniref:Fic/DOC family protein n=1 Tax=Seinonella peptonophila TaxID=112248 RepID=A0A1M5A7S7_9BACL|nr:Fic family protein [Seinonella peptonophila]SHF26086.1 Fic/DOC family protein [Seinonella peptonophila]